MAENKDNQILIDIEIPNLEQSVKRMTELRATQDRLKDAVKEQRKELKDLIEAEKEQGKLTEDQIAQEKAVREQMELNTAEIRHLNREINDNQKMVTKSLEMDKRQAGSLKEMRAEVSVLTAEWENLSQEQREGAKGEEIQQSLANLNGAINEASLSTKNFKDNIGNYSSAMDGIIDQSPVASKLFKGLGIDANTTAKTMKTNMVGGIKSVGASLKTLMLNPFFAILGGITVILTAILGAVKKNQAAMDSFQRIAAPLGKILDLIFDALGKVAALIGKVIEGFFDLFGAAESSATKAVKIGQELEEYENDRIIRQAKRNVQISDLEEELLKKEEYSHQERIDMAEKIRKLREEEIEEEKHILEQKIKMWELNDKGTDTSREAQKEYNEMIAQKIELDKKLIDSTKKHTKTIDNMNRALRQEAEAQQKVIEANQRALEQKRILQIELEKQTLKELEDILLQGIEDVREKELKTLEVQHFRQIEALQKRLETEQNLTAQAKENINAQIDALQIQHFEKLDAINARHRSEDFQLEIASLQNLAGEKRQIEVENLRKKLENENEIEEEKKLELLQTLTEIEDEYFEELEAERLEIELAEKELELEKRREELNDNLLFELELAKIKNDELANMDDELKSELFANDAEYELAVLKSRQNLENAEKSYQDAMTQTAHNQIVAIGAMAGAVSSMIQQMAGESEGMAKFGKALALVEIASNTGVAIAGAVKGAMTLPPPASFVALAGGVGAVAGGMASAYSALKSKTPQKPKELGAKSVNVSMPSRSAVSVKGLTPSIPTQVDQQAPVITELGAIEARAGQRVAPQEVNVDLSIVDVNDAQSRLNAKESFANM